MAENVHKTLGEAADKMAGLLDDPYAKPVEEPKKEPEAQAPETEPAEEPEGEPAAEATEVAEEPAAEEPEAELATEEGAEPEAETVELGADDLASLLGVDEDRINVTDDGALTFRVKGEEGETEVNLEKLVNAFQGDANLTNRSKQLAEIEKAKQAELETFKQTATQQAQQAAITLEAINNAYITEFESIDWAGLKAEDPAAWSAKTVEMQQKKAQLDNLVQQTLSQIQEQQKAIDEQSAQATQERVISEQKALTEAFKPLKVKVDESLGTQITDYLSQSFSGEEINGMIDHRLMLMAYKASLYDKGTAKVQDKKVKKIPKVLKKGTQPTKQQVQLNEDKKVRAKLKQSGDMRDAIAALRGKI